MVKNQPKMTALVVSAIRNLREVQGSTPREILNYIMSEYNAAPNSANAAGIQRKLCTALKRGLDYGILRETHGHYSLNADPETLGPPAAERGDFGPMDRGCGCKGGGMKRRRRRRAAARGGGGCKPRMRRGRRRGGGGRKRRRGRRGRSRGAGCGGGGGRRRRGRSRKSGGRRRGRRSSGKRRRGGRRRGGRRGKSCHNGRRPSNDDMDVLAKEPLEISNRGRDEDTNGYGYAGADQRTRRSHSRAGAPTGGRASLASRSRSHSRTSSSDRDGNDERRLDP